MDINTSKPRLNYLREVQQELKKVSWTSKEELIFSTKMVVISTLLFGIGIYVVDVVIRNFLKMLGFVFNLGG